MATDNNPGGGGTAGTQLRTGDLRFCCANAAPGDVIYFSITDQTINLAAQIRLKQQGGITIDGVDAIGENHFITISGQQKSRIFETTKGDNANIGDLTLTGGNG